MNIKLNIETDKKPEKDVKILCVLKYDGLIYIEVAVYNGKYYRDVESGVSIDNDLVLGWCNLITEKDIS